MNLLYQVSIKDKGKEVVTNVAYGLAIVESNPTSVKSSNKKPLSAINDFFVKEEDSKKEDVDKVKNIQFLLCHMLFTV